MTQIFIILGSLCILMIYLYCQLLKREDKLMRLENMLSEQIKQKEHYQQELNQAKKKSERIKQELRKIQQNLREL